MLIAPPLIVEIDPIGLFQTRIVLARAIVSAMITLLILLAIDRAFLLLILALDPGLLAIFSISTRLMALIILIHGIISFECSEAR